MRYIILLALLVGCSSNTASTEIEVPEIGDKFGGGIVLSTQNEERAWIISEVNQSEGIRITCPHESGGNQSANGWMNTKNLAEGCHATDTGAYIVWNLSLNGYDDWYVPDIQLLEWIYDSKNQTGIEMNNTKYWSSACVSVDNGDQCPDKFHWIDFSDGSKGFSHMDSTYKIRAVRLDTLEN